MKTPHSELIDLLGDGPAKEVQELARQWRWMTMVPSQRSDLAGHITDNPKIGEILGRMAITPDGTPLSSYSVANEVVLGCRYPQCITFFMTARNTTTRRCYCDKHEGLLDEQGNPQGYRSTVVIRYTIDENTNFNAFASDVKKLAEKHFSAHTINTHQQRIRKIKE